MTTDYCRNDSQIAPTKNHTIIQQRQKFFLCVSNFPAPVRERDAHTVINTSSQPFANNSDRLYQ
ncbi:hypothetical protein [Dapis sp. BLCC M229]|uniref:hypothetical protein n=1 Tax=Dapis sp. BLCC M229 TaxID=3400188 RepID=UPI003CF0FC79